MSLSLIVALALQAAPTGQWEQFAEDARAVYSVDPASIARGAGPVPVRYRTELRATMSDGLRTLIMAVAVDCPARTMTVRRMEGYRADGSLIRASDMSGTGPVAIPGDASGEAFVRRICGDAPPR